MGNLGLIWEIAKETKEESNKRKISRAKRIKEEHYSQVEYNFGRNKKYQTVCRVRGYNKEKKKNETRYITIAHNKILQRPQIQKLVLKNYERAAKSPEAKESVKNFVPEKVTPVEGRKSALFLTEE